MSRPKKPRPSRARRAEAERARALATVREEHATRNIEAIRAEVKETMRRVKDGLPPFG